MSKERYQKELADRAHGFLPFVDGQVVSGAVRAIMDEMQRIKHKSGSIIYPEVLSPLEITRITRILERNHAGLVRRIEAVVPLKRDGVVVTEILIAERVRK